MQFRFLSPPIGRLLVGLILVSSVPSAMRAAEDQPAETAAAPTVENSVVKVFATVRYPDAYKPWTKQAPKEITGSGVVIEGKRILTNAHLALYASQVQVQASQSGDKLLASVEYVAPGIDLAILRLDDESFFDTHPPLARARSLPRVKDAVMVYGFPTGGTSISITKGIVSRIDFVQYSYPTSGLRIQIDAAINPGNSGGPAMSGDKMIGLAFSRLGGADNIGYIIPDEEIALFIKDVADGHYDGKPAMFDQLQTFENPALRPYLGVDKEVEGMIVTAPDRTDPDYPLKEWDIITRIGDTPIDRQGMVQLGPDLRVSFKYMIQQTAKDGKVPLTIVRKGKDMKVELPVPAKRPMLLEDIAGDYPPYFILGPLAFTSGSKAFFAPLGNNARLLSMLGFAGNPLVTRLGDQPAFPGEELVVVSSPFFPNKLALGYSNSVGRVVESVNGIAIRNLRHLVEVLRNIHDPFLTFKFCGLGETLVFPREAMIKATDDILSDNDIRAQGSPELMEVWEGKAPAEAAPAPATKS